MTGPEQSGKGAAGDDPAGETGASQARDGEPVEKLDDSEIVGGLDTDHSDDTPERSTAVAASAADDDLDDDDDDDDDLDDEDHRDGPSRGVFLATLGVAVAAVLGVLVLVGGYIWPAFLGPGSPDEVAGQAVTALQGQDAQGIASLSCVRFDGAPSAQFPPELLTLITGTTPAGPPAQTLDSEARAPVDLTLAAGGESQTLPIDLLFGVNDGDWCLNGVSQRQ